MLILVLRVDDNNNDKNDYQDDDNTDFVYKEYNEAYYDPGKIAVSDSQIVSLSESPDKLCPWFHLKLQEKEGGKDGHWLNEENIAIKMNLKRQVQYHIKTL